jgi:hypothetical protein
MLEQLVKSIQSHLSDRLVSPLMGSVVVSWCLWNYKFLMILLSNNSVTTTLALVEGIAFPSTTTVVLRGVVFPFITAAAYIFIYPYPSKFVYDFTRRRQKELLEVRRRIEDETPLTLQESRTMRRDMERREKDLLALIDAKDQELRYLKAEISETDASVQEAIGAPDSPTLDDRQYFMLRVVESLKGAAPEKTAVAQSSVSKVQAEFELGELHKKNLLSRRYSQRVEDYLYEFTQEGRAALLRRKSQETDEQSPQK